MTAVARFETVETIPITTNDSSLMVEERLFLKLKPGPVNKKAMFQHSLTGNLHEVFVHKLGNNILGTGFFCEWPDTKKKFFLGVHDILGFEMEFENEDGLEFYEIPDSQPKDD
jgi:hypothetical protein